MKKNNRRIAEATASLLLCMAILLTGVRAETLKGARKTVRTAAAAPKSYSLSTKELTEEPVPLASPEDVFGQDNSSLPSPAPVVVIPETAIPTAAAIATGNDSDDDDSAVLSAPRTSSRTSKPSSYWGETTPSRKSSGGSSNTAVSTGDSGDNDHDDNDNNNENSKPEPPVTNPDDTKDDDKTDDQDPTIGDTGSENDPGTDDQDPETDDKDPDTGDKDPDTGDKDPDTGDKDPDTDDQSPDVDLTSTVAIKWLGNTNDLLSEFYALTSAKEKQELLGIKDNNFSNDSFRRKLYRENGDNWEKLESEIVAATQYQQGKTMYVQPYLINRKGSQFDVVIYANTSTDATGQWTTNLIYDADSETWYEYVKKHPYNSSREAYKLNYANNMSWSELRDEILSDENWVAIDGSAEPQPVLLSMSRAIVALDTAPIDEEEITIGASEEPGEMEETSDESGEATEEEEDEESGDEDEAHKTGSIVAIPEEETEPPVIEEEVIEQEDEQTEEEEEPGEREETSGEEDAPSDEIEE